MVLWCYNKKGDFYGVFFEKIEVKKGIYLQIYESFYAPERGYTAHKSYKALGHVDDLIQNGIDDPITFYKQEVLELNKKRNERLKLEKNKQISDEE